jgi:hypothetical protein
MNNAPTGAINDFLLLEGHRQATRAAEQGREGLTGPTCSAEKLWGY